MFGAITAADIHDKLVAAGFTIDRKRIHLFTPVKTLGKHTVKVKLHADVTVELSFDVVSENPIVRAGRGERSRGQKNRKGESKEVVHPGLPQTTAAAALNRASGPPSEWPTRRALPRSGRASSRGGRGMPHSVEAEEYLLVLLPDRRRGYRRALP